MENVFEDMNYMMVGKMNGVMFAEIDIHVACVYELIIERLWREKVSRESSKPRC